MIQCRYYLDTRVAVGEAPLKLAIHKRHEGAFLGTGIRLLPSQWDARAQRVINHPQKGALNSFLGGFKFKAESYIRDIVLDGSAADMTARDIKDYIAEKIDGKKGGRTLGSLWDEVTGKTLSENSRSIFNTALVALLRYDGKARERIVSSLSPQWVGGFLTYMSDEGLNATTQRIYLARVKKVFSVAQEQREVKTNPTEGFTVKPAPTRHRDLSVEQMRLMLHAPTADPREALALDFFRFSFYARATNPVDILALTHSNIYNGRADYIRAKTGKPYSVRIEPELQALIDAHTGRDGHLFAVTAEFRSCKSFLIAMNAALRKRSARLGLPCVSMYWARHTFASLAFGLGYGMDLVSAALGHSLGGARVTSVYVAVKDKQVDDLARAVYDAVSLPFGSTPLGADAEPRR